MRKISVAQNEANIRVRNETAAGIDHEGFAPLADLDLRHFVPDEFEVNLRGDDPIVRTGARHAKGQVGLRFTTEIDRAIVTLIGDRLDEFRVLRKVGLAIEAVDGKPRQT